jgi:type I restriction-modification system specificity subunit
MNKYERYRDTGLTWINKVPEKWNLKKINALFDERREKVSDTDYEALSVTKNGIFKQLDNVAKTNDGDNRKKVQRNDFVINSRSDRKGSSGLSDFNGSVSLINIVLRIKKEYPRYMHYLLKSVPFQEEFYRNGKGIVADLWSTNFQSMKSIILPIPPIKEQVQIANYLDWKINEIDRLIQIEKEKIKQLKICKQKYIDSLIETIDTVPQPLKSIFNFGKGLNITKENLGQKGIKCISYGEIHNEFFFSFSSNNTKLKKLEKTDGVVISKFANLNKGDFIFADTSEDLNGCGNFTFLEDDFIKIYAGYHTVVAKPIIEFDTKYLAYYFQSNKWRMQVKKTVKGIKVYSITQQILKSSKVQIPDDKIQKNIVNRADKFIEKINCLTDIMENCIKALLDLKQSLISEVVTGQIDVRDIAIPEYEKVAIADGEIEETDEMEGKEYGS